MMLATLDLASRMAAHDLLTRKARATVATCAEPTTTAALLRALREQAEPRLSYDELSKRLGFPRSQVVAWFTGKQRPSDAALGTLGTHFRRTNHGNADLTVQLRKTRARDAVRARLGARFGGDVARDLEAQVACLGTSMLSHGEHVKALVVVQLLVFGVLAAGDALVAHAVRHAPAWADDLERALLLWRGPAAAVPELDLAHAALLDWIAHHPRRRTDPRTLEGAAS